MHLRVVQPFGGHATGDTITDADAVTAIRESDHAHFVVAVPEPETSAAPATKSKE